MDLMRRNVLEKSEPRTEVVVSVVLRAAMAKVFKVSTLPFTLSEVTNHLQQPTPELMNQFPPVKQAGKVYLFGGNEDEKGRQIICIQLAIVELAH